MIDTYWYGIKVEAGANNNKEYEMKVDPAGSTFTARWGRVGTTGQTKVFPVSTWEKTIRTRLEHGYKDMTGVKVTSAGGSFKMLDGSIGAVVAALRASAGASVSANYAGAENVTQAQIEAAQRILDRLGMMNGKATVRQINEGLVELWQTLPRKMRSVAAELLEPTSRPHDIQAKLQYEQALTDQLAGQVATAVQPTANDQTILDAIGVAMREATPAERAQVLALFEAESQPKVGRIWRVVNKKTQAAFDAWKPSSKQALLFHGSRTPNWWGIVTQGLSIRPSSTNGSALGRGNYFANWADKSIGYTSLDGSRWGHGSDLVAFMAVFVVKLGTVLKVTDYVHDGHNRARRGEFDTCHAVAPKNPVSWPRRDEITTYDNAQSTIAYLVELVAK